MVGEHDFGEINAFTFSAKIKQWQQTLEKDSSLLKRRVAVVEDLGEEGIEPDKCTQIRLEQNQCVQLVLGRLDCFLVLVLHRAPQRLLRSFVAFHHPIHDRFQTSYQIALLRIQLQFHGHDPIMGGLQRL